MHPECDFVRREQRYERCKQSATIIVCILFLQMWTKKMKITQKGSELIKEKKIQIVNIVTSPGLCEIYKKSGTQ